MVVASFRYLRGVGFLMRPFGGKMAFVCARTYYQKCYICMFVSQAPLKSGGGDSWMNPMNKQFSNMGLLVSFREKAKFRAHRHPLCV
jgi:hypothetical protein